MGDSTKRSRQREQRRLSRRRWLQLTGAAGITTTIAGCSGGSDDSATTTNSNDDNTDSTSDGTDSAASESSDMTDKTLVGRVATVPTRLQFNPYNPTNQGLWQLPHLVDQLAWLDTVNMEFKPGLAKEWSVDGTTAQVTLREGQTWHNGDEVTADDLVLKLRLDKHFEHAVWDYTESVKKVDNYTVELSLQEQVNDTIFKNTLLPVAVDTPQRLFKEKLDQLENASSDDERKTVKSEISEWKIEEPLGNGPFKLTDRNTQETLLELHDGHPAADQLNFKRVKNKYYPGNQGVWQALMHNELDIAGVATPKDVINQFPDNIRSTVKPIYTGCALYFNHDDDVYGDERVRKALAHIIKRKPAAKNAHSMYMPVETPTAMPQQTPWLEGKLGDFSQYEPDEQKAAELLRDAGFERKNGKWYRPDGDRFKFPLRAPGGFSDWVKGAKTIVSHVSDFGIKGELLTSDIPTFFGEYRKEGNFRVLTNFWGGKSPYPYAGLNKIYGYGFPAYPDSWDVPMPVGDASGSTQTIKHDEKLANLSVSSGDEANQVIQELGWTVNQTLPVLPLWEQIGQGFIDTGDWQLPSEGSVAFNLGVPWQIRSGHFLATEE